MYVLFFCTTINIKIERVTTRPNPQPNVVPNREDSRAGGCKVAISRIQRDT